MTPEQLQNTEEYSLVAELRHDAILPFVLEYIWSKNTTMRFFWGFNIVVLIGFVITAIVDISIGLISFKSWLLNFAIGLTISFSILIVIHEVIHGSIYKWVGAPKISYGADLKNLVFYAAADRFVVGAPDFRKIALGPFIFVTTLCVLALLFTTIDLKWIAFSILLLHSTMCAGDFAMLSFYEQHKHKKIFTFDDIKNKVSYFYEEV